MGHSSLARGDALSTHPNGPKTLIDNKLVLATTLKRMVHGNSVFSKKKLFVAKVVIISIIFLYFWLNTENQL
jgi:hypothetical protein